MMKTTLLAIFILAVMSSQAQRSVVVIGSSTAAGKGATKGHGWVALTSTYLRSKGLIDTIYNLAVPGTTTWDGLPTGSVHPAGADSANPSMNVTRALAFVPKPKLIIVSYPSNDISKGWSVTQYLANLRNIYRTVRDSGVDCFITTTQPCDKMDAALRKMQFDAEDSILREYPQNSFDFYDTLVDFHSHPILYNIKSRYGYGDGIHVNDSGHLALSNVILSSQALLTALVTQPLALKIVSFGAKQNYPGILLDWTTTGALGNETFHIQRSADGQSFEEIAIQSATASMSNTTYRWQDRAAASGENFYRLRITSAGADEYSRIISCRSVEKGLRIISVSGSRASETIALSIGVDKAEQIGVCLITSSGIPVFKTSIPITPPFTRALLPVKNLSGGVYFVRVQDAGGRWETYRFLHL